MWPMAEKELKELQLLSRNSLRILISSRPAGSLLLELPGCCPSALVLLSDLPWPRPQPEPPWPFVLHITEWCQPWWEPPGLTCDLHSDLALVAMQPGSRQRPEEVRTELFPWPSGACPSAEYWLTAAQQRPALHCSPRENSFHFSCRQIQEQIKPQTE